MARHAPHAVIPSEDRILRVDDGGTFIDIPGLLGDEQPSGGEREGRSTNSDAGNPTGHSGSLSAPQLEFTAYAVVGHRAYVVLENALRSGDAIRFQELTAEQPLVAMTSGSRNAAIAANTGVVTFSGERPSVEQDLRNGAALRIGSNDYRISTVNPSTGATTVNPAPTSAVAAANYSIRIPSWMREWSAKVLACPTVNGGFSQGGEMQGPLRLQLRGMFPEFAMQGPA